MRSPSAKPYVLLGVLCLVVSAYVVVALELQWLERASPFRDPVLQRADDDRVIVRIDNVPILQSQLYAEAAGKGLIEPGDELDYADEEIAKLVDDLIDQRLMANEARRLGIDEDPTSQPRLVLARDRTLSEILMRRLIEDQVTEDSLRALYDEQAETLQLNEEVRARHILVADQSEAEKLARQLEAGANFDNLARRHSIDEATASNGGDLGYFTRADMLKPFSDTAFATAVGDVSKPFETRFGWHILKVEDRRRRKPPSFEELRPQILRYRTFDVVRGEIERLRQAAAIDYVQEELNRGD